jgi:hypothetical protein
VLPEVPVVEDPDEVLPAPLGGVEGLVEDDACPASVLSEVSAIL